MVLLHYCTVTFLLIVFTGTIVQSKFPVQFVCPMDYTDPFAIVPPAVNHSWIVHGLLTSLLALINVLTFAVFRRLSSARPLVCMSSSTVYMAMYDAFYTTTVPLAFYQLFQYYDDFMSNFLLWVTQYVTSTLRIRLSSLHCMRNCQA